MNRLTAALCGLAVLSLAIGCGSSAQQDAGNLPLRRVSATPLPGGPVRFDYTALDNSRGLLFIAHMGAGELVEVDVHAHKVVRTIGDLPDVHGVIVVPDMRRLFATATGRNQMVAIDEDSGARLFTSPTGTYPDGLAYDPVRHAVWTTNESAGTETVIDADNGAVRATVPLGGEVGNVVYDPAADRMVVAVQGRGELAVINAATFDIDERIPTPDCAGPHGQTLDTTSRVMFVGCEDNATLVSVGLNDRRVIDRHSVGNTPDVLVFDAAKRRLYVAAESGWVSVFDAESGRLAERGSAHLADGAHSVAVDTTTHHSYFPIPDAGGGQPSLWEFEPTT
jgi:DNA-binding beta-propeller fold protein YncE